MNAASGGEQADALVEGGGADPALGAQIGEWKRLSGSASAAVTRSHLPYEAHTKVGTANVLPIYGALNHLRACRYLT